MPANIRRLDSCLAVCFIRQFLALLRDNDRFLASHTYAATVTEIYHKVFAFVYPLSTHLRNGPSAFISPPSGSSAVVNNKEKK